jgi:hypothetical protein
MTLVQVPLGTTHLQIDGKPVLDWPPEIEVIGFGGIGPRASGAATATMATGWAPGDTEFAFAISLSSIPLTDPGGTWVADPTATASSATYQQWHRVLQTGDTGFPAAQLHWGRGAREAVAPSNGDLASVAGCLQVFVFAHSTASKTADWTRVEAFERNSRTDGTGPQIRVATHHHPFAGYVGGDLVVTNAAGNSIVTQFMVRPAS